MNETGGLLLPVGGTQLPWDRYGRLSGCAVLSLLALMFTAGTAPADIAPTPAAGVPAANAAPPDVTAPAPPNAPAAPAAGMARAASPIRAPAADVALASSIPPAAPFGNAAGWLLGAVVAVGACLTVLLAFGMCMRRRPVGTPARPAPGSDEPTSEGQSHDVAVAHAASTTAANDCDPPDAAGEHQSDDLIGTHRAPAALFDGHGERSGLAHGEKVIGYIAIASDDGHTADDPAGTIAAACDRAGWHLTDLVTDPETARGLERPGLSYALRQIADHQAQGLIIGELRRVNRSMIELGALMRWFRDADAVLIALDLGVDTSTPTGRNIADTLIALGESERHRIAQRTRSGLAHVRAHGGSTGRPAVTDQPQLTQRIIAMRANNMTLQAIADQLNGEHVPTARGGTKWRPSSVHAALGYKRPNTRGPGDHYPNLGNGPDDEPPKTAQPGR